MHDPALPLDRANRTGARRQEEDDDPQGDFTGSPTKVLSALTG